MNNITLQPGQNELNVTFSQYSSDYTSAADEESKVVNAVSLFSAAIGYAFAVNAVADIIPLAGSAEDAVNEAGLVLAGVGLDTAIVSAFSGISYSTSTSLTINTLTLTNRAYISTESTLTVTLFQSSGKVSATIGGTQYTFNSPVLYLKVNGS